MSFLIVDGERYALSIGETTLGGRDDELLATSPLASLPPFAVVTTPPEGSATIQHIEGAPPLLLDGQPLGPQRVPLAHGARLEIGGKRIVFGELRASGRTTPAPGVPGSGDEGVALDAAIPTAASGGRLVPRAGGRPIPIPDDGLGIGRDPDNGLVIRSAQASRRHARIQPTILGYTVVDTSTNGVFVNGRRIDQSHRLGLGDIIRFGDEEFRFEADAASFEPVPAIGPRIPLEPRPAAPRAPRPEPPTVPDPALRRATRPVSTLFATLEVITGGPMRGRRFRIERPIVHIGRGDYNEIVLAEDSISASHAMLIKRDEKWHLTDLGSRNGTYVDGKRVSDAQLPGACDLRLGNVRMIFRPLAPGGKDSGSTRGIVGITDEQAGEG